jgi:hypothetical protein
MYLCYGNNHSRVAMCSQKVYLPEELYSTGVRHLRDGVKVSFEYDTFKYTAIFNEDELKLACRVICAYHEDLCKQYEDDGWDDETEEMWNRAVLTQLASEMSSEDEEYDDSHDYVPLDESVYKTSACGKEVMKQAY